VQSEQRTGADHCAATAQAGNLPVVPDFRQIHDAALLGLAEAQQQADAEQSAHGIESLDTSDLARIVRDGLHLTGMGALADEPYPAEDAESSGRRRGPRCDLVVTDRPVDRIGTSEPEDTGLFGTSQAVAAATEARWIEFRSVGNAPDRRGPTGRRALEACVADAVRLAEHADITDGGLLIVHFAPDAATARADREGLMGRLLDEGLPVSAPEHGSFEIADRIGAAVCSVWLIPIRTG